MSDAYQGEYPRPAHRAYRRIDRSAGCPTSRGPSQPPLPSGQPRTGRIAEPACPHCHAWPSCCFCTADPTAMRAALRRIAELHSGCEANMCPERARLAAIPRTHRPAE